MVAPPVCWTDFEDLREGRRDGVGGKARIGRAGALEMSDSMSVTSLRNWDSSSPGNGSGGSGGLVKVGVSSDMVDSAQTCFSGGVELLEGTFSGL